MKLDTSKERSSKVAAKNEKKVELNEYIFGSKKVLYLYHVFPYHESCKSFDWECEKCYLAFSRSLLINNKDKAAQV